LATIAITLGEPAGIGPDTVAACLQEPSPHQRVIIGCARTLHERAEQLGIPLALAPYSGASGRSEPQIIDCPCAKKVEAGRLDPANTESVLKSLKFAADGALRSEFDAIVTAPVQKSVINDSGYPFTGHTEYFAEAAGCAKVVMMLAANTLRVALVTTHLPLHAVPKAITSANLRETLSITHGALISQFGIAKPRIAVLGLNPHAGEGGHLGSEEIDVISPTIRVLQGEGMDLLGPLPADTAFQPFILDQVDAVVAQYHDQGLPVLKYAGFGESVNITLGLPFIRTSVDHGTALDLAGTGKAKTGSLIAAFRLACLLAENRT
jgi:4-hydroxythreonine-4-phosphate dehydrogenase